MRTSPQHQSGHSLLEVLISMSVLAGLLALIALMMNSVTTSWVRTDQRLSSDHNGRTSMELIAREMSPATIDPCQQFIVMPGSTLTSCECAGVPDESMAAMWMAPLGKDGALRVVGYYLTRDEERFFYRLNRIYIGPENEDYYPASGAGGLDNPALVADATGASRLIGQLNAEAFDDSDPDRRSIASPVTDGVIGLWFQCFDLYGNPVPWVSLDPYHPQPESSDREIQLAYNSAAWFQVATSAPFEDGSTFRYTPKNVNSLRGNRIPAAVEITVVTLSPDLIEAQELIVPEPVSIIDEESNSLNVEASVKELLDQLKSQNITQARTFTHRVKLYTGT